MFILVINYSFIVLFKTAACLLLCHCSKTILSTYRRSLLCMLCWKHPLHILVVCDKYNTWTWTFWPLMDCIFNHGQFNIHWEQVWSVMLLRMTGLIRLGTRINKQVLTTEGWWHDRKKNSNRVFTKKCEMFLIWNVPLRWKKKHYLLRGKTCLHYLLCSPSLSLCVSVW